MNAYKKPWISVLITAYNASEYLQECLDSVFSQTIIDSLELVVVDDGSKDNTLAILREYKKRFQQMIVIHQENTGAGVARNRALSYANGEYVAFMDADDKYPRDDSLERLYYAAKQNEALLCGGNVLQNDNGKISDAYLAGDGDESHLKNCFISKDRYFYIYGHTRYLYHARLLQGNRILFGEYRRYEDQVFTVKALAKAGRHFELDYPVYEYRVNHKSSDYGEAVWLDIMKGLRDTICNLVQEGLELMYKKNCSATILRFLRWINKYKKETHADEWEALIGDIQGIMEGSGWSKEEETIRSLLIRSEEERKRLQMILTEERPLIVYGAGKNTEFFLDQYAYVEPDIRGIAVTSLPGENRKCRGFEVRLLKDFIALCEQAVVLITAKEDYRPEMEKYAGECGFKNVEWVDARLI